MRVLFCNKYNFPFSGTEAYIFEAMDLLRAHGHEAALFSMADPRGQPTPYDHHLMPHVNFKQPSGWLQKLRLAGRAVYSFEARRQIRAMIIEFRPDVAHVRNIYHHLSPSILWELKAQNVPVVYHVNDFKALCPSYNLVADGNACEACKGGEFWHAFEKKCYPGASARAVLVSEAYIHKWLGTYRKCVDCFLAPSQFVRDKFVEHGWDAEKFEVLPHFQPARNPTKPVSDNAPLLYFGRLSAEKGVDDLLRAMQRVPQARLVIAGDGPEHARLQQLSADMHLANVQFSGHLQRDKLDCAIVNSRFTVLPSHAYETFGKTILESYAQARAVIASDLGSRRELVQPGKTGLLYRTGDVEELALAIHFLYSRPELADEMGRAGWQQIRQSHTPQSHYESLINLYERLADASKRQRPRSLNVTAANAPLRIAFIGGRGIISKYSGIETYYEEVGRRLCGLGHEVTAYCRTYFTPAVDQHNGMRIVRLPTIRSKHLETLLHTFLSTLHVLTRPYDIVHYHALGPALFSFIPRLAGKKTVVSVQGLDWQRRKWGRIASAVLRLGERAAVRLPNSTIVVSRELHKYYRRVHAAETHYVPNGGLLRERRLPVKISEWGLDPGQYILFLGRFAPEKQCDLLIDAYEKLRTDVKLVLAGASSYCNDYLRCLRAHANGNINIFDTLSGHVLDELLTNAMIFVLPSDLEGLSLALLDAMGAGLCVLASDAPENEEAIEGAGFTFKRGNSADLADRLCFLIANPAVREAAGRAAKQRVREHYQWSRIASEIEHIYMRTMSRSAPTLPARKTAANADAERTAIEKKAS